MEVNRDFGTLRRFCFDTFPRSCTHWRTGPVGRRGGSEMRTTRSRTAWAALTLAAAAALIAGPSSAIAFDPAVEAQNFSKTEERQTIYNTPEYQVLLRQVGAQNRAAALAMQAADPERNF